MNLHQPQIQVWEIKILLEKQFLSRFSYSFSTYCFSVFPMYFWKVVIFLNYLTEMLYVYISCWYVQFLSYVLVFLHRLELKSPRSNCHILFVPWHVLAKSYYRENTQSHFMTTHKFPLIYINGKWKKISAVFILPWISFFSFLSIEVNKQTSKKEKKKTLESSNYSLLLYLLSRSDQSEWRQTTEVHLLQLNVSVSTNQYI